MSEKENSELLQLSLLLLKGFSISFFQSDRYDIILLFIVIIHWFSFRFLHPGSKGWEIHDSLQEQCLKNKLLMQVSRLIEMQTPLYLEGVCDLHPYFQIQPQELRDDNARTLQSQTTCWEVNLLYWYHTSSIDNAHSSSLLQV